jgi:hypothetical protein
MAVSMAVSLMILSLIRRPTVISLLASSLINMSRMNMSHSTISLIETCLKVISQIGHVMISINIITL